MEMESIHVPTLAELNEKGISPDILFWVGCAGSFDERAQKITKAMVKILHHLNISYGILGKEESCTGDPAKRAGNEFLFQLQAMNNIAIMNGYGITNIITTCPHCFNTLKNEYPDLGGSYNVIHHSQYLQTLIDEGKLKFQGGNFKGRKITYHDSCYIGRANDIYEAPRRVLEKLDAELIELKRCKAKGLCCGAGGAQIFKEAEKGNKEINVERTEEALATGATVIAANCPFCMTMLQDGVKHFNKEGEVEVLDLAELVAQANEL